jgi:DNA-directed RNA polymerase subunit RPC12/RpoP
MGRRHVKEFRPDEALCLISADREGKLLRCPSCGSEAVERIPPRPSDGSPTPGRIGLTCAACSRVVSYIDRGEVPAALR